MSDMKKDGDGDGRKMEWMYAPSALVNRDEYLLGRTVDKSFQLMQDIEQGKEFNYADEVQKDLTPLSIFAPTKAGPIDVIKKIKEDPLYQIQKKEEENLKQLLNNPVKLKQIRELNERQQRQRKRQLSSSSSSSKRKSKKSKGRRKNRDTSTDSEDGKGSTKVQSYVDLDKLISQKLNSLRDKKLLPSSDSSDDELIKKTKVSQSNSEPRHHDDYRRSSAKEHERPGHRKTQNDRYESHHRQRPRARSGSRSHERQSRRNESSSVNSRSNVSMSSTKVTPANRKNGMNDDEMSKRREEMMSNAKWRDDQRTKNVTKYREASKKEEEDLNLNKDNMDFIRKHLNEAAATGSVEKRIQSNSYNIQKSSSYMDKNFARR